MGYLQDLMATCCNLEDNYLKGIPVEDRHEIVKDYLTNCNDNGVDIDTTNIEVLSKKEQMVLCDACYTYILKELESFADVLVRICSNPFLRVICDHRGLYIKELHEKTNILESLINIPGSVSNHEALALAEYTENLDTAVRNLKISAAAAVIVYINIAIITICALYMLL